MTDLAPPTEAPRSLASGRSALAVPPAEGLARRTISDNLAREILISERFRAQLLAGAFGGALIAFLALSASYPGAMAEFFHSRLDRVRVGLLLGGFAAYELVALRGIEKLIQSRKKPAVARRYVDTLVETSLPTLAIVYYMSIVEPFEALLLPPAFVYFVFILLSTLRLDPKLCVFSGIVAAAEYALLSFFVLQGATAKAATNPLASAAHHLGKALILLGSGVAAGFVARRLEKGFRRTLESLEDRSRILSVFGQHVSPAVVEQLLAQKADVRSELREVCVMFLDVRNFTAFSERKSPEEVVGYLNALFDFMIESVNAHHGIVNKFLGDGFMAVFGAPLRGDNDCKNAVEAAIEIVSRLEALVADGSIPATRVGIGIASGKALIGNVGSSERKEYTVIGDVVNVASRVEGLNKELGSQILVTARVFESCGLELPEASATAPLHVRGRKEPVRIFRLA
ncbi:adenylate/guanylate cyclase domain-containing protein [Polyangium sp. 15x6]|uniref:adenylate/guanylate cyclase domain-containing protein n=1 Tax=Polyangium sp. 15x6 TaxID=3042687 RepID=UPI00249BCAC1|nr:adenylate/guanylate cyclase domain-containing protein [Polyangium sp. 15x6]MDI3285872.1 adenylate/guanylate cyclase domain-containing protein [Polyangium sp. 15x6]